MAPDWPATISAGGVIAASIAAAYALNGIRKSHMLKRNADRQQAAGDADGAKESRRRAAEELDLANLISPPTFRLLVVGIAAQAVAAAWVVIAKLGSLLPLN